MDILSQIATRIVKEQGLIIGPLALNEARKVTGVSINIDTKEVTLSGDQSDALNRLVAQYERLFGRASREVCKEAALNFTNQIPASQLPVSLR
jgi:hypothetical protein